MGGQGVGAAGSGGLFGFRSQGLECRGLGEVIKRGGGGGGGLPSAQGTETAARAFHTCALHPLSGQDPGGRRQARKERAGRAGRPGYPGPIDRGITGRDIKQRWMGHLQAPRLLWAPWRLAPDRLEGAAEHTTEKARGPASPGHTLSPAQQLL